ncbi:MAG: TatA/E family twin arginine-targeting protein translocase [Cyanobacteriota bacterium]
MNVFGIGLPELAVIAAIGLLVFGPKRLPELGRTLGKTLRGFQSASSEFEREFRSAIAPVDTPADLLPESRPVEPITESRPIESIASPTPDPSSAIDPAPSAGAESAVRPESRTEPDISAVAATDAVQA